MTCTFVLECIVTVAYRIFYMITLGGLIVAWFLDFDLTSSTRRAPPPFDPTGFQEQLAELDARVAEIGDGGSLTDALPFDPDEMQRQIATLGAKINAQPPVPSFDPTELQA